MALDTIFLVDGSAQSLSRFARNKSKYPHAKKFMTTETGFEAFKAASKVALTNFFYLVDHNLDIDFDFSFMPSEFDLRYTHVWQYADGELVGTGGLFLFDKKALRTSTGLKEIGEGLKFMPEIVGKILPHDIMFISYDEPNAEQNWIKLKSRFQYAQRVHGIDGILNAHIAAAKLSSTQNFFVVDGDSDIKYEFNFNLPLFEGEQNFVHVWRAQNPMNGLAYGYGGVKLFNKNMFSEVSSFIDMSTLLGDGIKLMNETASVTRFNSTPFHAFRGAFRECAKLASGIIKNQDDEETEDRLDIWCNVFYGEFADAARDGALAGKKYGMSGAHEDLKLINDFEWLHTIYSEQYE